MRWMALFLFLLPLGCATARPYDVVGKQFRYRIDFEPGQYDSNGQDAVEVVEIWGTRPRIEVGGEYLVVGNYTLASADRARLNFFLTAHNWDNFGRVMDLQTQKVARGTGSFVLLHRMAGEGQFHVSLYRESEELADRYIVSGDSKPYLVFTSTTSR